MSTSWTTLHARLSRSVMRHNHLSRFRTLARGLQPDRPFDDPGALLDWLHTGQAGSEAKNRALHELLLAARSDGPNGNFALELLILALWPGLCTMRQRLRAKAPGHDLDNDILAQITAEIRRVDVAGITQVAATLLRNVQRDLIRAHVRGQAVFGHADPVGTALAELPALQASDPVEMIACETCTALGVDGALIAGVYLLGFSQKEAGVQLGLSHDAARKRTRRAVARLREWQAQSVTDGV
jgi:RNA polymerase sigma-70 factor (ECF subfamily)